MPEKQIGKIAHYFAHVEAGIIELSDVLKIGDKIRIKGHTSDFTQDVTSMQIEHASVSEAKPGDHAGVKLSQKAHQHDAVYKVMG